MVDAVRWAEYVQTVTMMRYGPGKARGRRWTDTIATKRNGRLDGWTMTAMYLGRW